jgi:hypothetical protein
MLSDTEVHRFIEKGFVRIDGAFPREIADAGRAALWQAVGCDPHDRGTWTRPVVRIVRSTTETERSRFPFGPPPIPRLARRVRQAGRARTMGASSERRLIRRALPFARRPRMACRPKLSRRDRRSRGTRLLGMARQHHVAGPRIDLSAASTCRQVSAPSLSLRCSQATARRAASAMARSPCASMSCREYSAITVSCMGKPPRQGRRFGRRPRIGFRAYDRRPTIEILRHVRAQRYSIGEPCRPSRSRDARRPIANQTIDFERSFLFSTAMPTRSSRPST